MRISAEEINAFEHQLEDAGYNGALELVRDTLAPLAEEENLTLWEVAERYADPHEAQDTSWYQLWLALLQFGKPTTPTLHQGNYD